MQKDTKNTKQKRAKKRRNTYKKHNRFLYGCLRLICKAVCRFSYHLEVLRNEIKGTRGRRIIIANHESSIDFLAAYAAISEPMHVVASRSIIGSMPIAPLADRCGIITKNQFQTELCDIQKMKAVLDHEALLTIYPAGLMTESGSSTPIPLATAQFIKWLGADIYVAKINGTYLTKPKWSKVKRRGKISMDIYRLATKEEFAALSDEDADALIDRHLSFDAYHENEEKHVYFKNGDNLEGLENVLYKCPYCREEYTMNVRDKNILACSACGYAVKGNNFGMLNSMGKHHRSVFRYPSHWHAFIETQVYNSVRKNRDFRYDTKAKIAKINYKKHRYEIVGEGKVSLTFDNFIIDGIINGEPCYKEIRTTPFPFLPFQPGERFEIQHGKDIYRIYPDDGRIVMKWMLTLKAIFKIRNDIPNTKPEQAGRQRRIERRAKRRGMPEQPAEQNDARAACVEV